MSETEFGETFDIHGGGLDLIFPHHENEIAQSESAHAGHPFARVWMHNEMLTVDGVKMSKSLGNITTVRDILANAPGEAIRLALLMTHYRDPLDWTAQKLEEAKHIRDRLYRALALPTTGSVDREKVNSHVNGIVAALEDDLNSPLAIRRLRALAGPLSRYHRSMPADTATEQEAIRIGGSLMGLLGQNPSLALHGQIAEDDRIVISPRPAPDETSQEAASEGQLTRVTEPAPAQDHVGAIVTNPRIDGLIAERAIARKERRFADADRIRDALWDEGIVLQDETDGTTTWRRVSRLPFEPNLPSPRRKR
jgi:cysteinyl-tRNA synthetase